MWLKVHANGSDRISFSLHISGFWILDFCSQSWILGDSFSQSLSLFSVFSSSGPVHCVLILPPNRPDLRSPTFWLVPALFGRPFLRTVLLSKIQASHFMTLLLKPHCALALNQAAFKLCFYTQTQILTGVPGLLTLLHLQ